MAQPPAPIPEFMGKVWKVLTLLLVVTVLVWLTTMWRWQSAQFDPSPADLALNLALLPVVLTAALVAAVWGVTRLRRYAAAPVMPAAAPSASARPLNADAAAAAAPERHAYARVLASVAQVRAGANWSAAHSAIASGDCKADLDPKFKDDDGIAVFTAPHPDIDTTTLADALDELQRRAAQTQPVSRMNGDVPDEMLRSLALLEQTLQAIQEPLENQWPALNAPLALARVKPGTPAMPATPPPVLSIRVAIPARWPAHAQQLARQWLDERLTPLIDGALQASGQSRAMSRSGGSNVRPAAQWHLHPVEHAEAFWLLMDQQMLQWQRDKEPGLLLALACDSLVGEQEITALAGSRSLFSGQHQNGRVPGEASAALLLASPMWPAPPEASVAQAHLHRASVLKRDKSADASGRISPATLQQATQQALDSSGWATAKVTHLITDADHRASRTGEVFETVQELLPHLDPGEHVLRLGVGCGDLGVARLLACAALAASQVEEAQSPLLLLGTHPSFERLAAMLTPPVAPQPAVPAEQTQPS